MSHDMTNAMVIDYGWLNWFSVAHPDLGGCTLLTLQKAIQLTQRWFPRAGNWDSCPEGADCHCCVLREASTRVARGPERGVSTEIEEERPKKEDVEPLIWEAGAGEGGTGAEIGTFGKVLAKRGRVETVDLLLQLASLVYRLNSAGIVIVFSAIVFPFETKNTQIIFNSSHINSEERREHQFKIIYSDNSRSRWMRGVAVTTFLHVVVEITTWTLKSCLRFGFNLFWQQQTSAGERARSSCHNGTNWMKYCRALVVSFSSSSRSHLEELGGWVCYHSSIRHCPPFYIISPFQHCLLHIHILSRSAISPIILAKSDPLLPGLYN